MSEKQYLKIAKMLCKNDLSWYAVIKNERVKLMHETELSNILQCGHVSIPSRDLLGFLPQPEPSRADALVSVSIPSRDLLGFLQ